VPEPKPEPCNATRVLVDLEEQPPVTRAELDLVDAWLSDVIAELLSDVPEESN
jgi:hypothetical protein